MAEIVEDIEKQLSYIFLLLPGFLSFAIASFITEASEIGDLQIIFYSLIMTLISLSFAYIFKIGLKITSRRLFYGLNVSIAIVLGVGIGLMLENDLFFRALRSFSLTAELNKRSVSRPLTFILSQNTEGRLRREGDARPEPVKVTDAWARVRLVTGEMFEGWPEFYSDTGADTDVYLSPACVMHETNEDSNATAVEGPGVVLFAKQMAYFELIDKNVSACLKIWKASAAK